MKLIKTFSPALMSLLVLTGHTAVAQTPLSLNFSSTPGSTIQFNGANSSFQFNSSAIPGYIGSQWQIGSENGGIGSAIGLFGLVNNNPFSYGPVTTVINGPNIDESAPVTGPVGGLVISDGTTFNLTGNVNWVEVETHDYAGAINAALTVNISDLSYAGANPDLQELAAGNSAAMNLTFQFSPGMTLGDLTTAGGPYKTSYSGSLAYQAVPEPTTLALAGVGLLSMRLLRRRKQ